MSNITSTAPGWLGNQQAMSEYGGVSKRTIQRYITEGILQVRHLSAKKIICRPSDVDRALKIVADRYEMGVQADG